MKLLATVFGLSALLAVAAQETTVSGRVKLSRSADASGAVVWLTPVSAAVSEPSRPDWGAHARLLQKGRTFQPHVLVIPVGAAVEFPNQDPFFHNVFSLFEGKRFDLGLYEAGATRTVTFDRSGVSYIFCNIHPEMSAVVIALKAPYYGTSDRNGNVAIPNVPQGTYELHAWHERAEPENVKDTPQRITISDTSRTFGLLQLTEQPNFSREHTNKYGKEYDTRLPSSPAYGGRP